MSAQPNKVLISEALRRHIMASAFKTGITECCRGWSGGDFKMPYVRLLMGQWRAKIDMNSTLRENCRVVVYAYGDAEQVERILEVLSRWWADPGAEPFTELRSYGVVSMRFESMQGADEDDIDDTGQEGVLVFQLWRDRNYLGN